MTGICRSGSMSMPDLPTSRAGSGSIATALKPGGIGMISTTGYMQRVATEFLTIKYVFPGGNVPSLPRTLELLDRHGLHVVDVEELSWHYQRTAECWLSNFERTGRRSRRSIRSFSPSDFVACGLIIYAVPSRDFVRAEATCAQQGRNWGDNREHGQSENDFLVGMLESIHACPHPRFLLRLGDIGGFGSTGSAEVSRSQRTARVEQLPRPA